MHWPIGPAPSTTTRSPGKTLARLTARTAIDTGSASAATAGSSALIGYTCSAGTASRSCRPPSEWIPISSKKSHVLGRPTLHG